MTCEVREEVRELTIDEVEIVSGGEGNNGGYKELYNFNIFGVHMWGWAQDGHVFGCAAVNGNGSCWVK